MSTAEDDNGAENLNESHHNKVIHDDDDDNDDVKATKLSSRTAASTTPSSTEDQEEEATSNSNSRSRSKTPPVTVLPICCILDPEKGLFRVTRSKGKTLAAGGFGITISEPVKTKTALTNVIDTTPVDDKGDNGNGELDSHQSSEKTIMEEDTTTPTLTPTLTPATSTTTSNSTPNTSNSYLFIEEVLFLHERGMIECYRYDDDDNDDDDDNNSNSKESKLISITGNGDHGDDQGRQQQRLDSYQLYNMLEPLSGAGAGGDSASPRVSLPIYLVYAYLLRQDYRVLRHFDNRRDILDAMEEEKKPSQLLVHNDKDDDKDDEDKAGEDDDRDDSDDHKEGKDGASENMDTITNDDDGVRRKRKRDNKAGLKALRLQLRREAAQAPPPVLCNTKTNINASSSNNSSDDDDGSTAGVSIAFDVYRPNSNFCKGAPGLPDFYVAATHYSNMNSTQKEAPDEKTSGGASLSFRQIQRLLAMSAGRSLKIATVSDAGAVIMFGITDHGVPAIRQGDSNESTTNGSE
jgi:hypothetical protein